MTEQPRDLQSIIREGMESGAAEDPAVRLKLTQALAQHSPAGLALATGRGRWKMARHHQILNDAITECVTSYEGRLLISVSVRAGKSLIGARYMPAWYLGTHPEDRVIIGANSAALSTEHSAFARDILVEHGEALYGVKVDASSSAKNRWDLQGTDGGVFAVGVGGSPVGRGASCLCIDDPYGKYEDALSDRIREKVNETWFQGTLYSRLAPGASICLICSRWHEDDLSGFLKQRFPGEWKELHIPALCDDPEDDILGRELGESYWPEQWSTAALERTRAHTLPAIWQAQYQQRPSKPGGGMFPVGKLQWVKREDVRWSEIVSLCRGWDLAATEGGGDYTVGVLLGRYEDGRWIVVDVVRGQWGEANVRRQIADTAELDRATYPVPVLIELPQDPGSAGKGQAAQLGAMLSGHAVAASIQTGSKQVRAGGVAAQVQMENVDVIEQQDWTVAFVEELRGFDTAKYDDQVDALASAFNRQADTMPTVEDAFGMAAYQGMMRDTRLS